MKKVLVIDDEVGVPQASNVFRRNFSIPGFSYEFAAGGADGFRIIEESGGISLILLDIMFHGKGKDHGIDLLKQVSTKYPHIPVVMMSSRREPEVLIKCWGLGARSYLVKWSENARFKDDLAVALRRHAVALQPDLIVGFSPPIEGLREKIRAAASAGNTTVLIQGESGTGKELVARSIHDEGERADYAFVPVDCASIPENLMESEIFGHVKGSFTGATTDRGGKIGAAEGGVLFLDEIAELPLALQAKLLRVLQERQYARVGEDTQRKADFQLIAATNRDLADAVEKREFRQDLFYRLNVFDIHTPPLRDCREDICVLAERFLAMLRSRNKKGVVEFSEGAMTLLEAYRWPGNVRELQNAVERAFALTHGETIGVEELPPSVRGLARSIADPPGDIPEDLEKHTSQIAWSILKRVFVEELAGGRKGAKARTATRLGLHEVNGFGRKVQQIAKACPELSQEIAGLTGR